jgi:hypothetical protein
MLNSGRFQPYKHLTRLNMVASNKYFSLLITFVNYGCKKFYNIGHRAQYYKTFFFRNFQKIHNIVPGKLLKPSPMFVGKAGAYPSEAPFSYSNLGQAPGIAHKHSARLEKPARHV